jgi:hypothetical protein
VDELDGDEKEPDIKRTFEEAVTGEGGVRHQFERTPLPAPVWYDDRRRHVARTSGAIMKLRTILMRVYFAFVLVSSVALGQLTISPLDDSLKPYVSILTDGTPSFEQAWQELVTKSSASGGHVGVRGRAGYTPSTRPFYAIIQNISNEPLRGVVVVFTRQGRTGSPAVSSFTSLVTNPDAAPLLVPQQYREYTLLQNYTAEDLARYGEVTVSVEGVVTLKGVFLGPDAYHTFDAISARQQAEMWLVSRLMPLLASLPDVIAELESLSKTQVDSAPGRFERGTYYSAIRDTARQLLMLINLKGSADLLASRLSAMERQIRITK